MLSYDLQIASNNCLLPPASIWSYRASQVCCISLSPHVSDRKDIGRTVAWIKTPEGDVHLNLQIKHKEIL